MYGDGLKEMVQKLFNGNAITETTKDGTLSKQLLDSTSLEINTVVFIWMFGVLVKAEEEQLNNIGFTEEQTNNSQLLQLEEGSNTFY